jgi:hypothetical protein
MWRMQRLCGLPKLFLRLSNLKDPKEDILLLAAGAIRVIAGLEGGVFQTISILP